MDKPPNLKTISCCDNCLYNDGYEWESFQDAHRVGILIKCKKYPDHDIWASQKCDKFENEDVPF